jgi:sulfur-oxidizing protein SoxY
MNETRRTVLKAGGGASLMTLLAAAGWLAPETAAAQAWNKNAFDAKTMDETMKALGGGAPAQSKDIAFVSTPDIAENGAVVPVGVTSSIPKTESIAILIEKNPNMLAASFDIPAGTDPSVSTRVKMGQSSNVYALVKADGKYYVASKEIKVTLGGCGG